MKASISKYVYCAILVLLPPGVLSAQTQEIKIHFLYGSAPKKAFRKEESRWFGGKLGGHVGIETDSGQILSFMPRGSFHWIASKRNFHSTFSLDHYARFYALAGNTAPPLKKAVITIPVSVEQKHKLDSIRDAYLEETPYDYAFWGMRCAASTYEVLAQLSIVEPLTLRKTATRNFYPRLLRRRLFRQARKEGWSIHREEGNTRRHWDRD